MTQDYSIFLENVLIGYSKLEKADPTIGMVHGKIEIEHPKFGYAFLKIYCAHQGLPLREDNPDLDLIATAPIENLRIQNEKGNYIQGQARQLIGMKSRGFEIVIMGIPFPFYEEEFPHHMEAYLGG